MGVKRIAAIAACFVAALASGAPAAVGIDSIMGKAVHILGGNSEYDTLGWDYVLAFTAGIGGEKGTRLTESLGSLQANNFKLFKVADCSAVAAAILHDRGHRIVICSQWKAQHSDNLSFRGQGEQYAKKLFVTEFWWEPLAGYFVSKGPTLGSPFSMTMKFDNGGESTWQGGDQLCRVIPSIETGSESARIRFTNGGSEEILFQRSVRLVYVIAKKQMSPSKLVSEVEAGMDALKLDLSYKVPTFVEIRGSL